MNIAHKLADLVSPYDPAENRRWTFIDGPLPEAFAGIRDDGTVYISWRGENYTRQRITLRVRLHNWLNGIGNRRWERDNLPSDDTPKDH